MTETKELTSATRFPSQSTLAAAVVGLAIVSCSVSAQPIRGEEPQTVDDVFLLEVEGVEVETWVRNLQIPWSLVFLPNGDALVSDRPGRIHREQRLVCVPCQSAYPDGLGGPQPDASRMRLVTSSTHIAEQLQSRKL